MPAKITTSQVWSELERRNFAVLGFVTAASEARSAGMVYTVHDRKLYCGTANAMWKAKHIRKNPHVAITVPIAKRIPFIPWIQIPAATITFSGSAEVFSMDQVRPNIVAGLFRGMTLDDAFRKAYCIIEITPKRDFVTYGVGVSLLTMRRPADARGRAPVND